MSNSEAWHEFLERVNSEWPVSRFRDVGLVVGCSGGADSVALLRCLVELVRRDAQSAPPAGFVLAAHFNHGFRGQASDDDERFVRGLAADLGIEAVVATGEATSQDEESARNDRRAFFLDLMRERGARYLALGHSLDDNVETVLYRMFRGTGPKGLTGMIPFRPFSEGPPSNDFVIARPMLQISRLAIRQALISRNCQWREDESNQANHYQRNWIRNELLPSIQAHFPDAVPAIGRAIDGQRQWQRVMDREVQCWLDELRINREPLVLRRLDRWRAAAHSRLHEGAVANQAVAVEAMRRCWHETGWPLQSMGQSHWNGVYELLCGNGPDSLTLPGSISARREQEYVTLGRQR